MKSSLSTKPTDGFRVGIVGATGVVGETFQEMLAQRRFPVRELRLFASQNSHGLKRRFNGQEISVQTLQPKCFADLDLVFFSSGDDISKEWAPQAEAAGCIVVDNSAAFRMDTDKLLIVPEVNGDLLADVGHPSKLIANPNCSTIQLVLALAPLHRDFGVEHVHVASYQAVSGAGRGGQEELGAQLKSWASDSTGQQAPAPQTFPHPIAMNCIPQIGSFQDNGWCSEELKIVRESKKILRHPKLRISAFTVRVPAWNAHSEAVWIRLSKEVARDQIVRSLSAQAGLVVQDNPSKSIYPLAAQVSGQDDVAVGRIHRDLDDPQTWKMWIVGDNLRKGAALNGIQIAERILT